MTPTTRLALTLLALAASGAPARAADLPFFPGPPLPGELARPGPLAGGGFRVAGVPVRPLPPRYDVYGYPLLPGLPSPLAAGACPPALQPDYDAAGNLAGYAPIPMCR